MIRLLFIVLTLSGCAGLEHSRIAAENRAAEREMGIPEYGVGNRNSAAYDAAHGAAWWIGTDAVKKILTK